MPLLSSSENSLTLIHATVVCPSFFDVRSVQNFEQPIQILDWAQAKSSNENVQTQYIYLTSTYITYILEFITTIS